MVMSVKLKNVVAAEETIFVELKMLLCLSCVCRFVFVEAELSHCFYRIQGS